MSKQLSASERAYSQVKGQILAGTLAGGELISEGEIATTLGTSRTPVREAFLRLEAEGWMKLYPKRGALIVPVPVDEAEHVITARFVVETAAVRILVTVDRTALVADLRAALDQQRIHAEAGEVDEFTIADAAFHRMFVAAAGNPLLEGFYDTLRDRQLRMTSTSVQRDRAQMQRIIAHHTELADLIDAGDAHGFATSLAAHLNAVHNLRTPLPFDGALS
ncbi:GntR family transcriptional regulator [Nocardia sp. 348MFTsu5.1]|uniref:GntR family transcriptional regulator n=1 Tax=Nocardia sp. 348MFTsu5.1 TaxID=1172185 RepID=UPI0003772D00|nr:GntR family transcriptional regulator [Nocardia sp. 348MFTsu5.1]